MLTFKQEKYGQNYNKLYIVYRGMVSHSENDFPDTMVYYPVCFENILSSDGKINVEIKSGIVGESDLGDGWYYTLGYANPLVAYTELVVSDQDSYGCEIGDGFEKYVEYTPISSLQDIREEDLQTLINQSEDIITAYIAEEYSDRIQMSGLSLVGEYLLLAKSQGDDYENNNHLIIVFSATVSSNENKFSPVTVYYPIQFDGLINLPGEEFMYIKNSEILNDFTFPNVFIFSKGYMDGSEMFNDLVTAQRTDCTYEVSDGLKAFGT